MYHPSAPESIQALFASIAQHYDKGNTLFSFGLHKRWNQKLVRAMHGVNCLLDLCAGTGEIAFGFLKKNPASEAILLDFCPEMLAVAQKKGEAFHGRFEIIQGDAQAIPLAASSVDGVSISYGIRNVKVPMNCFSEVYRVLKPGGRFGILELTRPTSRFLQLGHRIYTKTCIPLLGKLTAKNKDAYTYLTQSVASFASPNILEACLKQVGFNKITLHPLLGGIATLIVSKKLS